MTFEPERMASKLDRYEDLLRKEIAERPHNPGAWVSLAWHYLNDGYEELGIECYERALLCAGHSYLPFKEMGYHHLRKAREMMHQCKERLAPGHQFWDLACEVVQVLDRHAPPHPTIDRPERPAPAPLPDWTPPPVDAG